MLTDLCRELNNWFEARDSGGNYSGRKFGRFSIKDGTMAVTEAKDGQYVRIAGSTFNDGVHQYPLEGLKDEDFDGAVWLMNVPPEVIALDKEIDAWKEQYGDVLSSPFQSESFGGYSYSKASGGDSAGGSTMTWQAAFADRLSHWRKI